MPDGGVVPGQPLSVARGPGDEIMLSWGNSCLASDTDYLIYEGSIGSYYSHASLFCTTGNATSLTFEPTIHDAYYLVVPTNGLEEGSYGRDGDGDERPPGVGFCAPQSPSPGCI